MQRETAEAHHPKYAIRISILSLYAEGDIIQQ